MAPLPPIDRPRRTSPRGALLAVFGADQLRALFPVLVVAASSGRFLLVIGVAVVLGATYNVASWWRRTWWFADGVLHLDEGVVVRSERRIPVERIQHVEVERKLRHQVFDLSVVRVETAGGSGAELRLDAITVPEAERLRASLAPTAGSAGPGGPGVETGRDPVAGDSVGDDVLVRLPPGRLLLAGITGPEVAAVLAALAVALDLLSDLGVDPDELGQIDATRLGLALAVVVGVPVWLLTAGIVGVVRRWDLTARIVGDDLRVTYGLLRKAEFAVNLTRIQDVRIAHRLLLRPFARVDVRVRTAASGAGQQSRVDIPLLDAIEVDRVLRRVLPAAIPLPRLLPAPPAARRRAVFRGGLAGAGFGALVAAASARFGAVALLAIPAGAVIGVAWGVAAYRGLGAAVAGTTRPVVHSRAGAFTRHHAIVPSLRVQSTAVESTYFQRRRGLASARLDLSGAAVAIVDRGVDDATEVAVAASGVDGNGRKTDEAPASAGASMRSM
ncbi:MAG: PH domain-containing protein [Acidimicrobiales bacterium]|nr:PH domain-containing protein [Acidimicrobiales bacterium]